MDYESLKELGNSFLIGGLVTGGAGALVFAGQMILRGSAKEPHKYEEQKRKAALSLEATASVGGMERIYFDTESQSYRNAQGEQVPNRLLGQENREYSDLSRHLGSLLTEMEGKGKALRADAFSFTEPKEITLGYIRGVPSYFFRVFYHQKC